MQEKSDKDGLIYYAFFALAHRALAAFRALRRRCSSVMVSSLRLPPIRPPLAPHVAHELLNDGKFRSLCGFQEYPAGVLDRIKFCSSAFPLWHTSKHGHCATNLSRGGFFK